MARYIGIGKPGQELTAEEFYGEKYNPQIQSLQAELDRMRSIPPPTAVSEQGLLDAIKQYQGSIEGLTPDIVGYEKGVGESVAAQKLAAQQSYEEAKKLGLSDLQAQYLADKERVASEQAATGRWGTGVGGQSMGRVEAARSKGLADLISSLSGRRAEQEYQTSASAPQQLLQGRALGLQARGSQMGQYGDLAKTIGTTLEGRSGRSAEMSNLSADRTLKEGLARLGVSADLEKAAAEGKANLENRTGFWEGVGGSSLASLAGGAGGALAGWGLSKIGKKKVD